LSSLYPLVSVIIPAYNAELHIKRAIESVIKQTYKNIEIIIIDDGSTDRTADIIKSLKDPRIIYFYQKSKGQGAARNYGIVKSKGEYITFLDADDFYLPEKVENQIKFLIDHPEYKIVYCELLHFYARNPSVFFKKKYTCSHGNVTKDLLEINFVKNPNAVMVSKEVFNKVGLFNEKRYFPEDWEMWLRISQTGFKFGFLESDLAVVELRENSNTTMDIQWILKKNALEMLENIFSKMPKKKRIFFNADKILKKMKFKLAIAYLIIRKKREFFNTIKNLYPYPLRIFVYSIGGILLMQPPAFLRLFLINLWKINQLRNSHIVKKSSYK